MSRRGGELKPAWLRRTIPDMCPLVVTRCSCGQYTIQDREGLWESWDYGLIAGDDLTVAIILERPLTRILWLPSVGYPLLRSVFREAGIKPDGQYLAMHECGRARISLKPWKPPKKERQPGRPWGGRQPTESEVSEFKWIWTTPYSQLKKK